MKTIYERIIKILSENNLLDIECIKGCTDHQLEKIKEKQSVTYLPEHYIEFMKTMGISGAEKIHWSLTYEYQLTNKETLIKAIYTGEIEGWHSGPLVELPEDIVVFYCGENIVYNFFRTSNRSDDPEVFAYRECEEQYEKTGMTFSDFLRSWVVEKISLSKR
jgi:hypothetical protein